MSADDSSPRSLTDDGPTDGPALDADRAGPNGPDRFGRRTFVKGLGVAGASAVGLSGQTQLGVVDDGAAVAPLLAAGAAVGAASIIGGSVTAGWALREFEIVGADAPADGLSGEALKNQVYQTARTRQSVNASTLLDNQNILDGVEHTAYTEAKVKAIEELNAGSDESAVLDAAMTSINTYETTVTKNFLNSWEESMNELAAMRQAVSDHPDLSSSDAFDNTSGISSYDQSNVNRDGTEQKTVDLADGTTMDITISKWGPDNNSNYYELDPTSSGTTVDVGGIRITAGDGLTYLRPDDWEPVYTAIGTSFQTVRDGISTWVANVYNDVQSGEIELSELVTPRERAAMTADGESTPRAIADLIALNVPVDLEREATITHESTGAKLTGSFGLTDKSDGPLVVGDTYDTSTLSGDVYFTTDLSLMEGTWDAFGASVSSGVFTLTEEPYEGTVYEVTTTAGETVSVPATRWTDEGDGTWTYDASGDLETPSTEIDSVRFVSSSDEADYQTILLDGSFTVDSLKNTETGEDAGQTSFSNAEPQTDSNYVTQEEWKSLEEKNKELIEKYEESQNNGGGLDLGGLDMFGVPGELVALGAAAVIGFLTLND